MNSIVFIQNPYNSISIAVVDQLMNVEVLMSFVPVSTMAVSDKKSDYMVLQLSAC